MVSAPRRFRRRALRPHVRALPPSRVLADVLAGVVHLRAQHAPGGDLLQLLAEVWRRVRDAPWNVADLRADGLLTRWEPRKLGHELARVVDQCAGRCGPFKLHRVERDRSGVIWSLRRW